MVFIRTAVEADIPRILELYRQLAINPVSTAPGPIPEDYYKAFNAMSALPGYHLLVVEEDSAIVGTAVLAILPGLSHNARPFAVVEYVVVDEKYRGRGIGRELMDYARGLAEKAGCYKIMLTSDNRREDAHEFYESIGFEASAHGFRLYF